MQFDLARLLFETGKTMQEKKKHYGIKLLLILAAVFCLWVYFWDAPAPKGPFEKDLGHEVLQN